MVVLVSPSPWHFAPRQPATDWAGVGMVAGSLWVCVGVAYFCVLYWATPDEDIADGDSLFGSEWYCLVELIIGWPWLMILHYLVRRRERLMDEWRRENDELEFSE